MLFFDDQFAIFFYFVGYMKDVTVEDLACAVNFNICFDVGLSNIERRRNNTKCHVPKCAKSGIDNDNHTDNLAQTRFEL